MLLVWLLRLLLAVLVIRVVWVFVQGVLAGARGTRPAATERSVALVQDPVCGTYIEPASALRTRSGTTTHYFCSARCQQVFLETV